MLTNYSAINPETCGIRLYNVFGSIDLSLVHFVLAKLLELVYFTYISCLCVWPYAVPCLWVLSFGRCLESERRWWWCGQWLWFLFGLGNFSFRCIWSSCTYFHVVLSRRPCLNYTDLTPAGRYSSRIFEIFPCLHHYSSEAEIFTEQSLCKDLNMKQFWNRIIFSKVLAPLYWSMTNEMFWALKLAPKGMLLTGLTHLVM